MAVWSAVKLSGLAAGLRLDAEYYQPIYLKDIGRLNHLPSVQLKALGLVTDGIHSGPEVADVGGVSYVAAKSVTDHGLAMGDVLRITVRQHTANARTSLKVHDVLVTTTGTIGWAAVVQQEDLPANIDRDVGLVRLSADASIDPYFLVTFLNCEYGRFQTSREATGNVQRHLFIDKLRELRIPLLECADEVSRQTRKAYALRREAINAIAAAETLLLESLGLDSLDLTPQKCYFRNFRDLQAEARFDAEYFNPKYQRVIKRLREGGRALSDLATLSERPFNPSARTRSSTLRYIEIGSLNGDGEAEPETIEVVDAPSRATWIVEPGDVITSTVRPIRRLSALIRRDQNGCICSSGFAVLTPKEGVRGVESEVLLTYLRLPVICEILDLYTTASMYPAIPTHQLMQLPMVVPDRVARKRIVAKVQDAVALRRQAVQLLEAAKKTVEGMIEHGTRWTPK